MNAAEAPYLLVVDDETPQMRALTDTLTDEGYRTLGSTAQVLVLRLRSASSVVTTDEFGPRARPTPAPAFISLYPSPGAYEREDKV